MSVVRYTKLIGQYFGQKQKSTHIQTRSKTSFCDFEISWFSPHKFFVLRKSLKLILTSVKATNLKQRRYYVQSKNCSVNSMVVHSTPNGKFALENGVVHITPNVTWYNDLAIFNNLPSLQLNESLYHLCRWIWFLLRSDFYKLLQSSTLFY